MPGKSNSCVCLRVKPPHQRTDNLCLKCVSVPMGSSFYHKPEQEPHARSEKTSACRHFMTHIHDLYMTSIQPRTRRYGLQTDHRSGSLVRIVLIKKIYEKSPCLQSDNSTADTFGWSLNTSRHHMSVYGS